MVRLDQMNDAVRKYLENIRCPTFDSFPWAEGPPLSKRRVAIISTAGLHSRGDRPFTFDPGDSYRIISKDINANDLAMSHVSTNFDHTGFQQDLNVVFPIDRLRELVEGGVINSIADFHYSFMGAHDPKDMEMEARFVAGSLKRDSVNAVLLLPV